MKKHKKKSKSKSTAPAADGTVEVVIDGAAEAGQSAERSKKRGERRRIVNEDLQLEITTLRQTMNEMLDRYRLKLDAALVQIADSTSGNGALGETPRQLPASVAEGMLKQIRALDIKPQKGRAKDLVRVQDLVGSLIEQLPGEK